MCVVTCALLGLLVAPARADSGAAKVAPPAITPLDADARALLSSIPADPKPRSTVRGLHYVVSNEARPHFFRDVVEDLGGALVGVGTEQNYIYAGWARPELIVPMDFDPVVVDVHRIYMRFFVEAPTPDAFIDLWKKKASKTSVEMISALATSDEDRKGLLRAWRMGRKWIHGRLIKLRRRYTKRGIPIFLTDQDQYDYLVSMVRGGRVHPVRGDLTKKGTLEAIGQVVAKLGLTIRVLYLSNAEQYFSYTPAFRESIRSLPTDPKSLVLRTHPKAKDEDYSYMIQTMDHFRAFLARDTVRTSARVRAYRKRSGPKDRYVIGAPPPPKEARVGRP